MRRNDQPAAVVARVNGTLLMGAGIVGVLVCGAVVGASAVATRSVEPFLQPFAALVPLSALMALGGAVLRRSGIRPS
jgi:hypothetical protein